MAGPNEIGKAKITIEGDIGPLKSDIQDAEQAASGLGDTGDRTGSRIGGAFSRAGEKISKSTGEVRKFVSSLTETIGIATGVVGVIAVVSGAIVGLVKLLKSLNDDEGGIKTTRKNLNDMFSDLSGDAAASQKFPVFEALNDRISELEEKLIKSKILLEDYKQGNAQPQDFFDISGGEKNIKRMQDELERLIKAREHFRKVIKDAESDARVGFNDAIVEQYKQLAESRGKFLDELKNQNDLGEIDFFPPEDQIDARYDYIRSKIEETSKSLGLGLDDEQVRRALNLIELQRTAAKETERLKDEAQAKRDAESAKRLIDAAERAAEAFSERLNATAGQNLTTRLDTIVARFDELISVNGRR